MKTLTLIAFLTAFSITTVHAANAASAPSSGDMPMQAGTMEASDMKMDMNSKGDMMSPEDMKKMHEGMKEMHAQMHEGDDKGMTCNDDQEKKCTCMDKPDGEKKSKHMKKNKMKKTDKPADAVDHAAHHPEGAAK